MNKKAIIIGICILLALGSVCVFASEAGSLALKVFSNNESINNSITVLDNDVLSGNNEDYTLSLSDINSAAELDTELTTYQQMVKYLSQTISDTDEFNFILMDYEYLKSVYKLTETDQDYIESLIISGLDAKTILSSAYFWVTTNNDITIIKSMYDLKSEFEGSNHWIENAYDVVTDYKNGSLTLEDIEGYYAQGLTPQDILTADFLCRKGICTIQEILAARISGMSFEVISEAIDNGSKPNSNEVNLMSNDSEINAVIEADELSRLTGKNKEQVYTAAENGEDIRNRLNDEKNNKYLWIHEELKSKGLLKGGVGAE